MTDAIIVLILCAVFIWALSGAKKKLKRGCCGASNIKITPKDKNKAHYKHKMTVYIDGMNCQNCKISVENAFNSLPGCLAKVNIKKKYAEIWSKEMLSEKQIKDIVEKNGYKFLKKI